MHCYWTISALHYVGDAWSVAYDVTIEPGQDRMKEITNLKFQNAPESFSVPKGIRRPDSDVLMKIRLFQGHLGPVTSLGYARSYSPYSLSL